MGNEQRILFINKYINEMKSILQNNDFYLGNDFEVINEIHEIISVFEDDIPNLQNRLELKSTSIYNDANVLISILQKEIIKLGGNIQEEQIVDNNTKLFNAINEALLDSDFLDNYIKSEYLISNYNELEFNVDLNHEFVMKYGVRYNKEDKELNNSIMLIELLYDKFILIEKHYEFTVYINNLLSSFEINLRLEKGRLNKIEYLTSEYIDTEINLEQFENKIRCSKRMILSDDIEEKKLALVQIVNALVFLVSIQDGDGKIKRQKSMAKKVNGDENSKVYSVIIKELEELSKIYNEYFDIRHNENTNNSGIREVLLDKKFIEYLYNRILGLVYCLRIFN